MIVALIAAIAAAVVFLILYLKWKIAAAKTVHKEKSVPVIQDNPVYRSCPTKDEFYHLIVDMYGGDLLLHSARMLVAFPLDDWYEFEKSELYRQLSDYLTELEKLSMQSETKEQTMK